MGAIRSLPGQLTVPPTFSGRDVVGAATKPPDSPLVRGPEQGIAHPNPVGDGSAVHADEDTNSWKNPGSGGSRVPDFYRVKVGRKSSVEGNC